MEKWQGGSWMNELGAHKRGQATDRDVGALSTFMGVVRSPGRGKNGEEGPRQNLHGQ